MRALIDLTKVLIIVHLQVLQRKRSFTIGEFAMAVNELREGIDLLLGRTNGVDVRNYFFVVCLPLTEALYVDQLENLLDDFMLSLNTEIDDGIEEIAESLMIMHEECLEGEAWPPLRWCQAGNEEDMVAPPCQWWKSGVINMGCVSLPGKPLSVTICI
ncbi:hypothetical protein L1987_42673 [Smallanthus sonchifolius]|uniref:Uncharacterized protein n=1 Tax=Smallanthus sonchifolius TaxID=185202 RepID=A0ACB9GJI8_9ASTR|nr:hypothetical protein L1987_42673 [Smallanthus sonchifolius]